MPNNFVLNMWHIYYKTNCNMHNIFSTENVLNLLENCNDKDFEDIVVKLNENTVSTHQNSEYLLNYISKI